MVCYGTRSLMAKHAGEELWLYMGYMGLTRQWPDGACLWKYIRRGWDNSLHLSHVRHGQNFGMTYIWC